jgi:hypothetical protein
MEGFHSIPEGSFDDQAFAPNDQDMINEVSIDDSANAITVEIATPIPAAVKEAATIYMTSQTAGLTMTHINSIRFCTKIHNNAILCYSDLSLTNTTH